MGWDVCLMPKEGAGPLKVTPHSEGGILTVGGNVYADISVTWNYSRFYYEHLDKEDGFRWLNEKTAKDTIERLEKAIGILGVETSNDYWKGTPGNAGHILKVLLGWAREHPEGEWEVS